ncbi:GntR family transcriptional regulator [Salinithrix halophila]|uniref:GntR family transcriptional regulator n=1 Tax=Salinithrix halophila TaxID=1485204 RepID=A0ABV8JL31_9BACL
MTAKMMLDGSLPNQIANFITEQVVSQKFKPGEQLREGELAEQFGTSRAPVREAFYILEVIGLVERLPRRGCFVKEYSYRELSDLFELRSLMEGMALERFDPQRSADHLQKMQEVVSSMRERVAQNNQDEYSRLNQIFHESIIRFRDSKLIETTYFRISTPLRVLVNISFWENKSMERSLKEHEQIVEALLREDIGGAKTILEKHNLATIRRLEKYFKTS